ncbi:hypothetical protein ACOBQX_13865 [Actinokineospora sp. G85]|uniref:hypothetical protein n=1 Tax=Actinokineospora sp. G85 TaxID=3406626 RepID=UPI003C74A330
MADGYTTGGELAGIAGRIKGRVEPIGQQADRLDDGQVAPGDFGRAFGDRGSAYAEALRGRLVAGVRAYATATSTYADRLTDTHRDYTASEQTNSSTVQKAWQ